MPTIKPPIDWGFSPGGPPPALPAESESAPPPAPPPHSVVSPILAAACSPSLFRSGRRTSRNRPSRARAYSLPCTPVPDTGCKSPHASTKSKSSDRAPGSSALRSSAARSSRYPEISAAARCPWATETARTEILHRKARCSRTSAPRCRSSRPDPRRWTPVAERKILPGCQPAPDSGKPAAVRSPGIRSASTHMSPSIIGVIVGSSV